MKKQKVMSHVKGQDKTPQKTKLSGDRKPSRIMIVKMIQDLGNKMEKM